jgi:hypothetical protein
VLSMFLLESRLSSVCLAQACSAHSGCNPRFAFSCWTLAVGRSLTDSEMKRSFTDSYRRGPELKTLKFKVFAGLAGQFITISETWPINMPFPIRVLIVALTRVTHWFKGLKDSDLDSHDSFRVIDVLSNKVLSADHFFQDQASSDQLHVVQIVFTSTGEHIVC